MNTIPSSRNIAPSITKAASQQTYYTIRYWADRKRVADAYRAYAYFRWVDDTLDARPNFARSRDISAAEARGRIVFLERQKSLLEKCYRGDTLPSTTDEEKM